MLTNAAFAQKDDASWRTHLKIVTQKGKQGVYNTKTKRFVIKPVYDEIIKNLYHYYGQIGAFKCVIENEVDSKKSKYIVIDSNYNVLDIISPVYLSKYAIVKNARNKKGIYNFNKGDFVTKVEFDTILFVNYFNNEIEYPPTDGSGIPLNFKPNKDLYAILGKKNTYQIFNVEQHKIDTTANIIYIKSNDKVYEDNYYWIIKDSKYQVINLPDYNYEFDSSFYLLNTLKVHVLNTDILKLHNKYGLYAFEEGKFYLPIEYDSILQEKNYYKIYKDGKLGYARRLSKGSGYNSSSNYYYNVISPDSNIEQVANFDEEIFTVKINGKWEFRNFSDNNRYDSIYLVDEKYTYNRKVFLKKDGKWSLNFIKNNNEGRITSRNPTLYYKNKKKAIRKEKRKNKELYKVMKQQPCCGYSYQTLFLWNSFKILNKDYSFYYVAKLENKTLILNSNGFSLIKLNQKKVFQVGLERLPYQDKYFSSEKIDGYYKVVRKIEEREKEFVYVIINKNPIFKEPYHAIMYLQNGKLVRQPNFKSSIYSQIKNYLRERKEARQENRKRRKK